MGYHNRKIEKGILGESSKILEEVMELIDSEEQNAKIMAICELADIIGAIDCYREKHFPDISMDDINKMRELNKRAFLSGDRK